MIIITGATGTLGTCIIKELLQRYSENIICIIRDKTKIKVFDPKIYYLVTNLKNPLNAINDISVSPLIRDEKVRVLINCAGICENAPFAEIPDSEIIEEININLSGTILLTKWAISRLDNESGHIINIASLAGRIPMKYCPVYTATKYALIGFTESLRLEYPHFKISCFLPTVFDSPMSRDKQIPSIVSPISPEILAKDVVDSIGVHSGLKTTGIQSTMALLLERISPSINRIISKI